MCNAFAEAIGEEIEQVRQLTRAEKEKSRSPPVPGTLRREDNPASHADLSSIHGTDSTTTGDSPGGGKSLFIPRAEQ